MLQNAYFLAKIGADTAENEQHFAEILPTDALTDWNRPGSHELEADDRRPVRHDGGRHGHDHDADHDGTLAVLDFLTQTLLTFGKV